MIKINLLPPEFRKRSASFNPLMLVTVAEVAVLVLLLGFSVYVKTVSIKSAQAKLDEYTNKAASQKILADNVQSMQNSISSFNENYQVLAHLLARKVYWAHTLDDFCTMLDKPLPNDGVVRCLSLSISPAPTQHGAGGIEKVNYTFSGRYQLVGDLGTSSGQYVRDMFSQIQDSPFWMNHGFQGKPEDTYFGDSPQLDKQLSKLTDSFQLEFKREHVIGTIAPPKAGG